MKMKNIVLLEYEGLTKDRCKTVLQKVHHCGFNAVISHLKCQVTKYDRELTLDEMKEDGLDLQPIQPNTVYIKAEIVGADKYKGKGDPSMIASRPSYSWVAKLLKKGVDCKEVKVEIDTESPVEDEIRKFTLDVCPDIVFYNKKGEKLGWYHKEANIMWLCDVIHNPSRANTLLDQAISAVYELQKIGQVGLIRKETNKILDLLKSSGYQEPTLFWTGFETSEDSVLIGGQVGLADFLDKDIDNMLLHGCDIFFLREVMKSKHSTAQINTTGKGLEVTVQLDVQNCPAHTSVEEQKSEIESYLKERMQTMGDEFFKKIKTEVDKKRMK
jgi:hypothetical protein